MDLDLKHLIHIARRRWWIVVILMLLTGSSAYVFSSLQKDQFSASAKLLVISGKPDTSTDYNALQTSQRLAETYRQLIETGPVMDRVVDTLDLPYPASELDDKVSTSVVEDTQIVQIDVTDHDAEQAALLASTIASEFRTYITEQVDPRIGAQVEVADPARVPIAPFSPVPINSFLIGLAVGAMLGLGFVTLLEYLDDTVKPESNIVGLSGAPVLATVARIPKLEPGAQQAFTMVQPQSGAAESMRLLRTNLEFASASEPIHSITITSPSPGEGKSTTTANLGIVMAQSGLTVALIDGDLRKPTQHLIFGVENDQGLTTLLTHPETAWETVGRKVALLGLHLIPSGPIPPNPSDLLSSERFSTLIDRIKADVDVVLIDSSPVLSASDALSISQHTDGVILVCQSHKTRTDALRASTHSFHQGGIRIIGVVLNQQQGQQGASYYGEYYGLAEAPVAASSFVAD